jgi:gas vesicle protein
VSLTPDQIIHIGAFIGGLVGAVAWLFKALIKSQDARVHELEDERDYWRDVVLKGASLPDWEAWQRERHAKP